MDTNDFDCPQYVDFASGNFLEWSKTVSPAAFRSATDKSECCDFPISESLDENGINNSVTKESADQNDMSESSEVKDTDSSCGIVNAFNCDSLMSGSLEENYANDSLVEESSNMHNASKNVINEVNFSNGNINDCSGCDSLMYGSYTDDSLMEENPNMSSASENVVTSEVNFLSGNINDCSGSSSFNMPESVSSQDFPLHRANLNILEVKCKKEASKAIVRKVLHLKKNPQSVKESVEINSQSKKEGSSSKSSLKKTEQHEKKKVSLSVSKSKKRKSDHYMPLAEQVAAFQKKTPQRFHTTKKGFEPVKCWSPPRISPHSPNLHAAKRRRMMNVLSEEEKEKLELEDMQKHQFHAKPLNPKIFDQPQLPKVPSKPATKPKDINFKTAQRAAEQFAKKEPKLEKYEFHARPVPSFTRESNQLKKEHQKHVTKPISPQFALKSRMEKWKSLSKKTKESPKSDHFKALPPPTSVPFTIKHEKKATEIQPFSFDAKDKERYNLKIQKIEEEIQKENMIPPFKAQPVPNLQKFDLPQVPKKPTTEPEPFRFSLESKSTRNSSMNSAEREPCFKFKAQPATVLKKQPFVPEKPEKPLPEVKPFHLHTDIRASERQQMKELKQIEEEEKERALLILRQQQEEQERLEILQLRRELVHKANPIRQYKCIEIQPSSKSLTAPISPKFATEERLLLKHQ